MLEQIETIVRLIGLATVPVLAAAVIASFRRRDPAVRATSPTVVACAAFVGTVTLVGVVAGLVAGIPWLVGWTSVTALLLVAVLLRRDERFWAALSVLLVAYCAVGVVSVLGLAHNYDAKSGGWRGVRLLVAWAGPEANPQSANFALAVTHLSIVRYGLPLAVTVALAWVLATRRHMSRLERVSLILVGGTFLGEVVVGSTLSAITFAVGLVAGLPLAPGLAGLVASLFMLLTVGPGAVTGIVVGVRWLVTTRQVDGVRGLVTTLRDVGSVRIGTAEAGAFSTPQDPEPRGSEPRGSEPPLRSLLGFLRGNVGWVQRLNIVVIVLAFVVVGGLGLMYRAFSGDPERVEVAYQHVTSEAAIDGRVLRKLDGASEAMWLLTRDQRLHHFDPATERLTTVELPVSDAQELDDRVVALTAEATPRVVLVSGLIDGAGPALTPVATLAHGSTPSLAVVGDTAYVAESSGRLLAIGADGKVARETKVEALTAVLGERSRDGRPGVLWTLHPAKAGSGATYRAIQRHPATLAELRREAVTGTDGVLRWDSGLAYDVPAAAFYLRPGTAPERWGVGPHGRLNLHADGRQTRYDFHYDAVVGVRETSHGTWLVVDDHTGIALTPRAEPTSYLVRWPGAPAPAS